MSRWIILLVLIGSALLAWALAPGRRTSANADNSVVRADWEPLT